MQNASTASHIALAVNCNRTGLDRLWTGRQEGARGSCHSALFTDCQRIPIYLPVIIECTRCVCICEHLGYGGGRGAARGGKFRTALLSLGASPARTRTTRKFMFTIIAATVIVSLTGLFSLSVTTTDGITVERGRPGGRRGRGGPAH